jgi:hypothetical protein
MVVLIGVAGLGVDMGVVRYEKRIQQSAADAAAIAGANNLASSSGGVIAGGQNASAGNGFTDNAGGALSTCTASGATVGTVCVQISDPASGPTTGPHKNNANYVEAYVSEVHDTYFIKIFGVTKQVVTARAVATNLSGTDPGCLYLLGPSAAANSGLTITGGGNGSITAPTCGVVDNGDFRSGSSNGWFATSGSFAVAGSNAGGKDNVTCSSGQSPCPAYSVPAGANPLASLTPPPVGSPTKWNNGDGPGTYSGMSFGNGNSNVVLPAGVYVLDGGDFSCKGNETITGTGVTFYLTNGASWQCSGTPSVNLTAPSAPSPYAGILIYQDPSDHASNTVTGTSNTGGYGGLVVLWGLTMKGTDTLTLGGTAGFGTSVIKNAVLVE